METKVVSDKNQPMMVVSRLRRKGCNVEITGRLMGAWPSKMYVTPKEFGKMALMALRPGVLLFLLLFPVFLLVDAFRKDDPRF